MDTDLRLVWMNDAYLAVTMRERDDIIGRRMFEAFPSDPDTESFRLLNTSLRRVLETAQRDEIALIRYDIPAPDGSFEPRYWSATHTPILDDQGKLAFILQHTVDVTEMQKLRQFREEADVIRRAEKVQSLNESLARESRRLHQFFDQAPGFVAVLGGPQHVFQMANASYLRLVGRDDIIGVRVADALPEVVDQGFVEILDRVFESGEPYFGQRERVVLAVGPGQTDETRVLNFIFQPIRNAESRVSGIIVQGNDVTHEAAFEERQGLLISELQHRVKNAIAVVQSLAKQTFKPMIPTEEALDTYSARLSALSAAHGLLSEGSWGPTSLRAILVSTLGAALGDIDQRVSIDGPDHLLDPETALGTTMLVHELATNAIKYGSLSNDKGEVMIRWAIDDGGDEDILHLIWKEVGGPVPVAPQRKGFGTRLIERGLGSRGTAGVNIEFLPSGLECRIDVATHKEPQSVQFGRSFAHFNRSQART
ncbi:PAS domain-containing protein [Novosphingopyxis iocasae]|uniref:sensor histidine kinase n=1 Tax=Novosphingopyxis iocasae TaxID=2762729 RepID=UPI0016513CB1